MNTHSMGLLFVNLPQARVVQGKGASNEGLPRLRQVCGTYFRLVMNLESSVPPLGRESRDVLKRQAEQARQNKPVSITPR